MRLQLNELAKSYRYGKARGIVSVCSAHPIVLRAAIRHGLQTNLTILRNASNARLKQCEHAHEILFKYF